jgi:mercuric ion transport protein
MSAQNSPVTPSCNCATTSAPRNRFLKWSVGGGVLASLGVCAACCLLPMLLIVLGAGGAWVSALNSLAPYKWIFIAATVLFLGYGFYAAYWKPACSAGTSCAACGTTRSVRIFLWVATVLAIAGLVFEQIEPMLG